MMRSRVQISTKDTTIKANKHNKLKHNRKPWLLKLKKRSVAPDFDEAFSNEANIEFAPMALQAVAQHPKGAEIAYMLGKDVFEAYRIAALPPSLSYGYW